MTEPMQLRIGDLSEVLTITRGFPTQRTQQEVAIPVMSVAALRSGASPKHFATRESLADLGLDVARPNDVLVSIEGGTVGESLVVSSEVGEFVPSQQAATLRITDLTRLDPWYLGSWLATEPGQEQLRRLARGSGIQRIPMKDLSSVVIPIPSLVDQRAVADRFRAFESAIQSHRAVAACLEELRDLDLVVTFASDTRPGSNGEAVEGGKDEGRTESSKNHATNRPPRGQI